MTQCRINVKEIAGKVIGVTMQMALGPWPMKNWSCVSVNFWHNLEAAKHAKAYVESLPDHLGRELFIMMSARVAPGHITEAEVREHYDRRIREESLTRSYTIE